MNLELHLAQLQQPPAIALIASVLMLAAGYGIGVLATLPFPAIRRSVLRVLLLTVLGLDLIALCSLFAAPLVVMAPRPVLWAVSGAAALYGAFRLRRDLSGIFKRPVLLLFTAGFGVFSLGSALCLPYAWDEQVYQAALPFRYLTQGSAAVLPDNPYSALASMNHFLLLIPCKLGGVLMPRLLVWSSYLLIFPWLYLLLERRGKVAAAILTLAVVLAPVTPVMNRNAYAEGYILLNLLAGLTALRLCRKQPLPMALYLGFFPAWRRRSN